MSQPKVLKLAGIGTHWWINVYDPLEPAEWYNLEVKIKNTIEDFERNYSRFLPGSYVSKLNVKKKITDFPPELYALLDYALKAAAITGGHFSPLIGSALESLGYDPRYSFAASTEITKDLGQITTFTLNEISISKNTIIDLGGVGKGWLIDKIAVVIQESQMQSFSINGGGDIFASHDEANKPLQFYLEDPVDPTQAIGTINVYNGGIGCSAPNRRRWEDKKTHKKLHHLVDAKTGEPVDDIAAVFTSGKTALAADTASTAIFVSPPELLSDIARHFDVEYLIVSPDGQAIMSPGYMGVLFT